MSTLEGKWKFLHPSFATNLLDRWPTLGLPQFLHLYIKGVSPADFQAVTREIGHAIKLAGLPRL